MLAAGISSRAGGRPDLLSDVWQALDTGIGSTRLLAGIVATVAVPPVPVGDADAMPADRKREGKGRIGVTAWQRELKRGGFGEAGREERKGDDGHAGRRAVGAGKLLPDDGAGYTEVAGGAGAVVARPRRGRGRRGRGGRRS